MHNSAPSLCFFIIARARSMRYSRRRSQLTRCCQSRPTVPKLAVPMKASTPRLTPNLCPKMRSRARQSNAAAWIIPNRSSPRKRGTSFSQLLDSRLRGNERNSGGRDLQPRRDTLELRRRRGTMSIITRRRFARGGSAGLVGALATTPAPAVAQTGKLRWRMVTSWPKRLPGPGVSAERLAERIGKLSGGRLEITVSAAGEIVPAFEVLDAVGSGVAEIGHTAAFYWQGAEAGAPFFTTRPFGLAPNKQVSWIDAGGGQALWDELY